MGGTAYRALVTGGSRGIGRAIARALTRAGHEVTVLGRSLDTLKQAVAEGDAVAFLVVDATDSAALTKAIASAGPFHILINNAGAAESAPFAKTDDALLRRMLAINVESAFTATRAVLPGMLAKGSGRIVNIASIAGLRGYAYVTAYCAAKHALIGMTRALAAECAKGGVTVNALCPGYTDTDLVTGAAQKISTKTGRSVDDAKQHFAAVNPLGRLITPEEVAGAAVFLCSEAASAITGQAITIAGGEA
jgi:NAD(P)-dependent dehydrogenase (short-subunit alcohol dehydrogenase family)